MQPPHRASGTARVDGDQRPVEFWPTSAIRAALETDDLAVWQRIVVAIKRDPYGRTARQVEEVLERRSPTASPRRWPRCSPAPATHLEANERAEVARHMQVLLERSGLSQHEFASRIGVPADELRCLPGRRPPARRRR